MAAGNVETSQRVVDTLLKALGLAACSQGTMNNVLFGNDRFGYYETVCGGCGAGPGFDGADALPFVNLYALLGKRFPEMALDAQAFERSKFAIRHEADLQVGVPTFDFCCAFDNVVVSQYIAFVIDNHARTKTVFLFFAGLG